MNNDCSNIKKYPLSDILNDSSPYVQSQALEKLKTDLDHRRGGDFRDITVKSLIVLLEKQITLLREIDAKLARIDFSQNNHSYSIKEKHTAEVD